MRSKCLLIALFVTTLTLGGCGGDGGKSNGNGVDLEVTKHDVLESEDGTLREALCVENGQSGVCDLCAAMGWYQDGECDQSMIDAGFCAGPDPDCEPQPADYYVAPNGDDANPGTEASPFATVQHAHDVAQPGDLIYLRGGTYFPAEQTRFRSEGTLEAPITLRSYPGEFPVIDGANVPEGNTESGSTPTWLFNDAKHWIVQGPLHLTNGRGAGVAIEGETTDIELRFIESSYNGKTAARAGHGFLIVEYEWADAARIRFIYCDAHHNANHLARSNEDWAENQYQHGDGFRIKSGEDIKLIGCRAWHNLDDNYDLVWAAHAIDLVDCWAAYAGMDDAQGSITGTPNHQCPWGIGFKLGYNDDTGTHRALRCLSWGNVDNGFLLEGGPYKAFNCASYRNGRRGFYVSDRQANELRNCFAFDNDRETTMPGPTASSHNSWDADSAFSVSVDDFRGLDDAPQFGPRTSDGSLPVADFLRLQDGSDLIDTGTDVGLPFGGAAPDIGCFEKR